MVRMGKTSSVLGTSSVASGAPKGSVQSLEVRGLNQRMQDRPSTLGDPDAHATDPSPCFFCCRKTEVAAQRRVGFSLLPNGPGEMTFGGEGWSIS